MGEETLKPCPFCGSDDLLIDGHSSGASIECQECLAEGPFGDSHDGARELWNRRPSPTPDRGPGR